MVDIVHPPPLWGDIRLVKFTPLTNCTMSHTTVKSDRLTDT